jgi:uncharacterized protein (TIGR00369 family)
MSVPEHWGQARRRDVAWFSPAANHPGAEAMTGLEFLEAIRDGVLPPPPMAALIGMVLTEVGPGAVTFECTADESTYNPLGIAHGGLACTLADSAAGCAVLSSLPAGVRFTSIDLHVQYLRPVTADSGTLRATGTLTRPASRVAFSSAEIHDGAGRLVCTATSSCLVLAPG